MDKHSENHSTPSEMPPGIYPQWPVSIRLAQIVKKFAAVIAHPMKKIGRLTRLPPDSSWVTYIVWASIIVFIVVLSQSL